MELLSTIGISKKFGNFWANRKISFKLNESEIISILGENGAGKTTLMNILYGLYKPDEGYILIKGKKTLIRCPKDAIDMGILMVHQHFMLVDSLTVIENIILGNEPTKKLNIDFQTAKRKLKYISEKYGLGVNINSLVGKLSVGEKQLVELLKALYNECSILILDEPTAVLTPIEVEKFFIVIRKLRSAGKGIILISHKLKETIEVADRIYIMRAGEIVAETKSSISTTETLAELMVGHPVNICLNRLELPNTKEILKIDNINYFDRSIHVLKDVCLSVMSGKILGIAGVDGNGQTELIETVMGLKKAFSGKVFFMNHDITQYSVKQRIKNGIGYIPEDRQKKGLVGSFSIKENLILGYQWDSRFSKKIIINWNNVAKYADKVIKNYDIRCKDMKEPAVALSGGNQQKLVIGRVLEANPNLIIAANPTRGVDIGAVEYIHKRLIEMRNIGKAILLVSADLDEILKLSDHIAVIYEGKIVASSENGKYTKTKLGFFMTGGVQNEA